MLKPSLISFWLIATLVAGGSTLALTGCSSNEKKEVSQDGRQAYDKLQAYATEAEAGRNAALPDTLAARLAAVDRHSAEYDSTQQVEIERIRKQYMQLQTDNVANAAASVVPDTTGSTSAAEAAPVAVPAAEAPARRYTPRRPAAVLTAATARVTYEAFIQKVKANEDNYEIGDWRAVNADWRALDKKYDQVKGDVSGPDKREIAKEKLKYAAFKSFDKAESRVSQTGDLISGDKADAKAKGKGVQVGRTAGNAGSDVVSAGKDVGKGAVKVGKKVGGAVKDVFDGKDDKKQE